MKVHSIEITIVEDAENNQTGATLNVNGSHQQISKALCGLLQSDVQFRMLVMEAIVNAIGSAIKIDKVERIGGQKP